MNRIGLYLMGKKGLEVLRSVSAAGDETVSNIAWVITSDDPNVKEDHYEDIVALCDELGIECLHRKASDAGDYQAEYAITIGWRWLIHDFKGQLIVLHDSLLPKYRGFNPLVTALIEGDTEIGVTAIEAEKEFDSGAIYGRKGIHIQYPITIQEAIEIVSDLYGELVNELLDQISDGTLTSTPQDETNVSYSVWRNEEDYQIDWQDNAERIARMVDAVGFPYLGAKTIYNGQVIRIRKVTALGDLNIVNRSSGKILRINDNQPEVICGQGMLRIDEAVDDETGEPTIFNKLRVRLQ